MTDLGLDHGGETHQSSGGATDAIDGGLRQWLVGALVTIVMALISWWVSAIDGRVTRLEDILQARGERLSTVETRLDATQRELERSINDLKESSKRIEAQLMRLMEREQNRSDAVRSQRFDK